MSNLEDRVNRWTYKSLSLSQRLVLTKVFLQMILGYMLSILLSPKGFLQKIREIQRNFLGGAKDKRKWAFVA